MSIKVGCEYVGYIDPWTDEERLSDEEIVRCRDCSLCAEKGYRLYCDRDAGGFPEVEPDGFCAWGERKDA